MWKQQLLESDPDMPEDSCQCGDSSGAFRASANFSCTLQVFKPEELRQALMPTLEALYRQDPESLPFRQPVDPQLLGIPVSMWCTSLSVFGNGLIETESLFGVVQPLHQLSFIVILPERNPIPISSHLPSSHSKPVQPPLTALDISFSRNIQNVTLWQMMQFFCIYQCFRPLCGPVFGAGVRIPLTVHIHGHTAWF